MIERDAVFVAALELIDANGIDKLSMRTLASKLGVNAASLYHHFNDKDEILDGVARLALDSYQGVRVDEITEWDDKIVTLWLGAFKALSEHPHIVPVLIRRADRSFAIGVHDRVARLLKGGGVPEALVVPLLDTLEGLLIGAAVLEAGASSAIDYSVRAEQFPALHRALQADDMGSAQRLEAAVRALLRGWVDSAKQVQSAGRRKRPAQTRSAKRPSSTRTRARV